MPRLLRLLLPPALLALAACGGAEHPAPGGAPETGPSRSAGYELPSPKRQPDFALRDQEGRLVRLSAQHGRVVLVTFLYTHCPDVCPLIAENLNQALRRLGPARSRVRVLAVSVDPEGDSPAAVRSYVRIHRLLPQFRYLTGSRRELEPVWRAYKVVSIARDPDLVDHTAPTILIDREGNGRALYTTDVTAAQVVPDVRLLLEEK